MGETAWFADSWLKIRGDEKARGRRGDDSIKIHTKIMGFMVVSDGEHEFYLAASRLCIVTAAEIEFKTVVGLLAESSISNEAQMKICRGRSGNRQITVLKSQIGAGGFAKRFAGHLRSNDYEALLIAGLAGALDPKLKTGDAIVYDLCYDARPNPVNSDLREKKSAREENASIFCHNDFSRFIVKTLITSGFSCFYGAGATVDHIVTRAQEKAELRIRYNADAVDMETYEVMRMCSMSGLEAAALRVISDEADSNLPDFNLALRPDGTMGHWLTASAMLISPIAATRFLLSIRGVVNSLRDNLSAILNSTLSI